MFLDKIHAIWNPECYHGWNKSKKFFEGWYYKIISKDQKHALAIIPGIAMDETGKKQAFIQVLDGKELNASYHKFDASDFVASSKKHDLQIQGNRFTSDSIELDLPDLKGKLHFTNRKPWSTSFLSPGIMGPFSFVPFMECYHGILSMNHGIEGSLIHKKKNILLTKEEVIWKKTGATPSQKDTSGCRATISVSLVFLSKLRLPKSLG